MTGSKIINFEKIQDDTPDDPNPDEPILDNPTPDDPIPDNPTPDEPEDDIIAPKKEVIIKKVIGLAHTLETIEIIPDVEDLSTINFIIKDPNIIKIENNKIIPLSVGETDIEFEYLDNKYIVHIEIKDEDLSKLGSIKEIINNPTTKDTILIVMIILFVSGFGIIAIRNKKVGKFVSIVLTLVVLSSKFIPRFVYAETEYVTFYFNYNIKILPQRYKLFYSSKIVYGNMSDNLTLSSVIHGNDELDGFYSVEFYKADGTHALIPKKNIDAVLMQDETKGYYYIRLGGCVTGDTVVYVYDKKKKKKIKKKIKDLTYDDLVLCWDFDNGDYTYSKPLWIKKEEQAQDCYLLEFDNGTNLKIICGHRIYCVNKNRFVNAGISEELEVGDTVFTADGKTTKLVSQELIVKPVISCNVILDYNVNLFTGDILSTACNFPNMYEIENMKYIVDSSNRVDVSKLNVDQKYIKGLRLDEVPKDFMRSEEETIFKIDNFVATKERQKEQI